jgi:cation diffusion facilitator family transporter
MRTHEKKAKKSKMSNLGIKVTLGYKVKIPVKIWCYIINMNSSDEYNKPNNQEKGSTGVSKKVVQHKKNTKKFLKRLYLNILISTLFMIGEIIGGIISGSIAIITDAFHVFTDILGFIIIIISLCITQKPASLKYTYGFYRAEVIGTMVSIALIWGLTAWLLSEAVIRFIHPEEIDGLIMLLTALGSLAGNVIMGIVLVNSEPEAKSKEDEIAEETLRSTGRESPEEPKKKTAKSLNMRAAIIHVLGDSLQSVGVIIAGAIIYTHPDYTIADPVCTVLFCIVVLSTTIPILKDCVRILMETSPKEINMEDLQTHLSEIEEITSFHDLHVWSLSSGKFALSCHLVSDSPNVALDRVTKSIKEKFGIGHLTLQIENFDPDIEFVCENDLH